MIFGHLDFLEKDKTVFPPAIQKGLNFLAGTDLKNLTLGRHDIDGDNIFAMVSEYTVEPKAQRRPEAHQKYIDIQCVAYGEEKIGFSLLSGQYEVVEDNLKDKDLLFFGPVNDEVDLILTPGCYAVFFPWDVHRPGCFYRQAGKVKKIVIKIAVALLE